MAVASIEKIIADPDLSQRIFQHLTHENLLELATVNSLWYQSTRHHLSKRTIEVSIESLDKLHHERKTLQQTIHNDYKYAVNIEINGWSSGKYVEAELYDELFNAKLKAKRLVLYNRGEWSTCRCPKDEGRFGEQFDPVKANEMTNFEYIQIASQFRITSCALLDLISRSPKLKEFRFYGVLKLPDHHTTFSNKTFHSDLDRLYWPWPAKKCIPTISLLAKRNDNLNLLYTNIETACDLLASDVLPNLKHLSLILNENWDLPREKQKRAYEYLQRTQYISSAKNLEALEVRTFDLGLSEDASDETRTFVERIFENYKLTFWEQVAKIPNLKYLAIYGAWELEKICRELAKHALPIEYLKINLSPASVLAALAAGDDNPILRIDEEARNLRKLQKLRSLHYICSDKVANIDKATSGALKELIDLIWILDVKTRFTDEVEDLLNIVARRGAQVGKVYRTNLLIQPKHKQYVNSIVRADLRPKNGQSLRDKFITAANSNTSSRFDKIGTYDEMFIWGIEHAGNVRDDKMFRKTKATWRKYNELFKPSYMFI